VLTGGYGQAPTIAGHNPENGRSERCGADLVTPPQRPVPRCVGIRAGMALFAIRPYWSIGLVSDAG
jgi:hypothetical protein